MNNSQDYSTIRSSVTDSNEVRQQKINAIVNRFNSGSKSKKSEYTDEDEYSEDDEDDEDQETFSLDDDLDDFDSAEHLKKRLSKKSNNRKSVVDQIRSDDLEILGHKNSITSTDREVML